MKYNYLHTISPSLLRIKPDNYKSDYAIASMPQVKAAIHKVIPSELKP